MSSKRLVNRDSALKLLCASYLRVTEAPASSNLVLISSASAVATPSLTTVGAPSTSSLASLRPRPVISQGRSIQGLKLL